MRGAEAILTKKTWLGRLVVIKSRIAKEYRVKELDQKLRIERTRSEARLLNRTKLAGVRCPTVLEVDEFELTLSFVGGDRPKMDKKDCREAGEILAKLHENDIIHGDYTPANLISNSNGICVIDFGLGFVSTDIEDRAVDVFTMLRSLNENKTKEAFIDGYKKYSKAKRVLERLKIVEKRVRYAV